MHKVRYVDLGNFIQQCIQKCNLSIVDVSKWYKIEHTRNDYLQEYNNYYGMWLHNPDWKILPTISFGGGYPLVLTCKDHDRGYNLIHNNCCGWRTNIPSHVSDQVCHSVVKPWTVKQIKVGYNSTGYKMVEQQSSWKVPDNSNVSSDAKTDPSYISIQ